MKRGNISIIVFVVILIVLIIGSFMSMKKDQEVERTPVAETQEDVELMELDKGLSSDADVPEISDDLLPESTEPSQKLQDVDDSLTQLDTMMNGLDTALPDINDADL